jgi:hypothetical protein
VYQHQPELYNRRGSIQPDFKTMRIETKYASGLRWDLIINFQILEKIRFELTLTPQFRNGNLQP